MPMLGSWAQVKILVLVLACLHSEASGRNISGRMRKATSERSIIVI